MTKKIAFFSSQSAAYTLAWPCDPTAKDAADRQYQLKEGDMILKVFRKHMKNFLTAPRR